MFRVNKMHSQPVAAPLFFLLNFLANSFNPPAKSQSQINKSKDALKTESRKLGWLSRTEAKDGRQGRNYGSRNSRTVLFLLLRSRYVRLMDDGGTERTNGESSS